MAELDVFERRVADALRAYAAEMPAFIDAAAVADRVADERTRREWRIGGGLAAVPGFAWVLLLAGLLLALVVGGLAGGLWRDRDLAVLVVPSPSPAATNVTSESAATLTLEHPGEVMAVAWSPDGARLATTGSDGTVRTWDATTGAELSIIRPTLPEEPFPGWARAAYSPDGARIAVGLQVYDAATADELVRLQDPFMAWSPDGTRIATAGDYAWAFRFQVCDAATGDVLVDLGRSDLTGPSGSISPKPAVAWSPDGTRITRAAASQMGIRVIDAATGNGHLDVATSEKVADAAWSPDGTRIAVAESDWSPGRSASIWDAATGGVQLTLTGRSSGTESVAWSPDGTRLVTAGSDGAVVTWDAATGEEQLTLTGHAGPVIDVAWSLDGSGIATASRDGTARVWRVGPAVAPPPRVTPAPMATPFGLQPLVLDPLGQPIVSDTPLGRITWQRYASASGFRGLTGTPNGPVAGTDDGTNTLRWLGRDGAWGGLALPWEVTPLTWDGDALFTSGAGRPRRLSWEGSRWTVGDVINVPDAVRPVYQIATGPRGTMVYGGDAGFAIAGDGEHFVVAARPPLEPDRASPFVLATADGFVALVSREETSDGVLEPVPWFTADGRTWEQAVLASPFGERAWIDAVAGRDSRFVAVGRIIDDAAATRTSAVWASDDGVAWERVLDLERGPEQDCNLTDSLCPIGVTAGDAGWVVYSKNGSAWASVDGRTWEPLGYWPAVRPEGLLKPQVAVTGETIVVIGYPESGGSDVVVGTIEP